MTNGTVTLPYLLYSDSSRTLMFGSATGIVPTNVNGTGVAVPIQVYGQIPAGNYVGTTGTYADLITATVSY
jgi:spore coat protein U-like protein